MTGYPFVRRLSSFVGRAVVFFLGLSVLLVFFYALGSVQGFLETTQLRLLSLLRIALWLQVACGLWYGVSLVVRVAAERRALAGRWILLLLALVEGAALLVVLQFVRQWLEA